MNVQAQPGILHCCVLDQEILEENCGFFDTLEISFYFQLCTFTKVMKVMAMLSQISFLYKKEITISKITLL